MMEAHTTGWNRKIAVVWGVLLVVACVVYFTGISSESIWYDEAFSEKMTEHSPMQIIQYTMQDNHPPLYYLLLKGARTLFGSSEAGLRALSALAAILIIALGAGPVRRLVGNTAAIMYAVAALFTPVILIYAHEARMYTLAMLSVTAGVLYGYLAVTEHRRRDWILYCIATLAAAYLHYYGLIAAAFTHLLVLIIAFVKQKDARRPAMITSAVVLIAYLPWLLPFINQIKDVQKGFWLGPVTLASVVSALYQPLATKDLFHWPNPTVPIQVHLAVAVGALFICSGVVLAIRQKNMPFLRLGAMLLIVYLGTLISAVVFSMLVAPIFYARYMLVCTLIPVLLIVLSIQLLPGRVWRFGALGAFALINAFTITDVYTEQFNHPMKQLANKYAKQITADDLIVTSDSYSMGAALYYFPKATHLHISNPFEAQWGHVLDAMRPFIHEAPDKERLLNEHQSFWYIHSNVGMPLEAANVVLSPRSWVPQGNPETVSTPTSFVNFSIANYRYQEGMVDRPRGSITVHMTGTRPVGQVFLGLWTKDPIGPTGKPYRMEVIPVEKEEWTYTFRSVEYGAYAVVISHDENKNYTFDFDENGNPAEGSWFALPDNMTMKTLRPEDVLVDKLKYEFNQPEVTFEAKMFYPGTAK